MNPFTRLFMLLAIVVFAASPLMACCLTGHAQTTVSTIQSEALSCHNSASAKSTKSISVDIPSDCPGCIDCETTTLTAEAIDHTTVPPLVETQQLIILVNRWINHDEPYVLRTAPPPRTPPRLHTTPTSLKQRLLV